MNIITLKDGKFLTCCCCSISHYGNNSHGNGKSQDLTQEDGSEGHQDPEGGGGPAGGGQALFLQVKGVVDGPQ